MQNNQIDYKTLKTSKSGLPTWDGLAFPTLLVLGDSKLLTSKELRKKVVDILMIPDELKNMKYPSDGSNMLENRVSWCSSELTSAGLLTRPIRANYKITELGKKLLNQYGTKIDAKIIHQQKPYIEHQEELKERNKRDNLSNKFVDNAPSEQLDESVESTVSEMITSFNNSVATDLLNRILQEDPYFFESLVVKLLSAMGYQGDDGTSITTKATGDSGIDGIINQDPLGTSTVYIQAKKYKKENTASRPEIDTFYGALASRQANRGVFITTSSFSSGAKQRAEQSSIVLIDGIKLTKLMLKYHVGVQLKDSFDLFEIDEDFFG